MARIRTQLRKDGVLAILNSAEMNSLVRRKCEEIQARANASSGDGYKSSVIKTDRAHGAVYTGTYESAKDNARHNTLLKSIS